MVRLTKEDGTLLPHSIPLILTKEWKSGDEFKVVKDCDADSNSMLRVEPVAIDLIKRIKKPIAVMGICGPYRCGKSYFMSQMLNLPSAFEVGHEATSCTHGIMMATTVLECDEYIILFLDMEGIGAVGRNKSSKNTMSGLLVMTTLLSSFLIYNLRGVLDDANIFRIRYSEMFPFFLLL